MLGLNGSSKKPFGAVIGSSKQRPRRAFEQATPTQVLQRGVEGGRGGGGRREREGGWKGGEQFNDQMQH